MKVELQFEKLQKAISADDEDALKSAIAAGIDINSKDYHGRTLLMFAAEEGRTGIVKMLIRAKAKLDVRDQMNFHDGGGKTALHRAVANRHADIADMLIGVGAKVDVADKVGQTPLELAISNNDLLIAEKLLKAGADPNGSGKTVSPLSTAVALKSVEAVRLLLKYKADPNHPADAHRPVLASAAFWGPAEACRLLIEAGAKIDAKDADGKTALDRLNKTIDPQAWKILPPAEVEKLKCAVQDREQIKAMLFEAGSRISAEK